MPRLYIRWSAAVVAVGLSVLLTGCGEPGGSREVRVEQREWTSPVGPVGINGVQLLTEHYDIRTTVKDEVLREYLPTFMEAANAEYRKLMPPPKVGRAQPAGPSEGAVRPASATQPDSVTDQPLIIYLFATRVEWSAFTRRFVPKQAETYLHIHSGGYMDYATATSVVFDLGRDRTLSLIAHEGLHQYLARYFPRPVPAWLNEGLATQFEDFDLDGARPTFRPKRNLSRKNNLREALIVEKGMIPIQHLLAMDAGEAVTKTGQPARGYYAQIWATVSFLRESPQYRQGFARLLADAGTDRLGTNISAYRAATPTAAGLSDGEIAFRQYITENLEDFADECIAYARDLLR